MLKTATQTGDKVQTSLGEALRTRRKELKLNMQSVADQAGLSVGFISQVERGLTAPSLASLVGIARVLDIPLSTLLDQPADEGKTTRRDRRPTYGVPGAQKAYERLSTTFPQSRLHSVIFHEPPGHRSEPISHAGEEMFYILKGAITVEIEEEVHVLNRGDSIHFDSRRTHSSWNHTEEPASILWCGTLDVFSDAPAPIHKSPLDQPTAPDPTGKEQDQ
ncbi:MAG: cupin domain-containing protein [Pseudomonadota bacterium]